MLWPKKYSYKEFVNKKKFLRPENSPPPHNFSNGPSLSSLATEKRYFLRDGWGREALVKSRLKHSEKDSSIFKIRPFFFFEGFYAQRGTQFSFPCP